MTVAVRPASFSDSGYGASTNWVRLGGLVSLPWRVGVSFWAPVGCATATVWFAQIASVKTPDKMAVFRKAQSPSENRMVLMYFDAMGLPHLVAGANFQRFAAGRTSSSSF